MSAAEVTCQAASPRRAIRRGSMLLEVLLALSILTLGMATVGIQISTGFGLEAQAAQVSRRVSLIESMLAQLEVLVAQKMAAAEEEEAGAMMPERELEIEGEFGPTFPGYAYRVLIEPTEVEMLKRVTIELLQGEFDPETGQLESEPQRVYLVRTLRATPPKINLNPSGGGLGGAGGSGGAGPGNLPPSLLDRLQELGLVDAEGNFDPQKLVAMDPAALLEVLPALMSAFGGGQLAQLMAGMSPEQLMEALQQQQSGQAETEAGGEGQAGSGSSPDGAATESGGDFDNPPDFNELNPGGGLTQEQFEWMLRQLQQKQRERQ